MSEYIVMLWPSDKDAANIEIYRQEICRGCDVSRSLTWPAHLSLFYGIRTGSPEDLANGIGEIANNQPVFNLSVTGLGTWNDSLVYLRIAPCPDVLSLQRSIRRLVNRLPGGDEAEPGASLGTSSGATPAISSGASPAISAGASAGAPPRLKPDGTPLTAAELKHIEQWGSFHPFRPHITLAHQLSKEHCERVMEAARKLTSLVPRVIQADKLSVGVFDPGGDRESGVSESLASFRLGPGTPGL